MRRAILVVAAVALALSARGAVFTRYLSADRPGDRAIMGYLELVKSGKATSMDLADLGVLILEKGFPGDAEDYLRAALKADPHNYEAAYRMGLVLQREGKDREAARYYRRTLKERRGYAEARFMLALAEERCGEREDAIRDYAKSYRYNPRLADPARNPLVLDSDLQTEAMLRHYREQVGTSTLKVTEIDPAAIRRMMQARPAPDEAAPAAAPAPQATPQASRPTPAPAKPAPQAAAPPRIAPAAPSPSATPRR